MGAVEMRLVKLSIILMYVSVCFLGITGYGIYDAMNEYNEKVDYHHNRDTYKMTIEGGEKPGRM